MATVQQVYDRINRAADFSLAMDFDNPGLLVGDPQAQVTGALIALDVTDPVIDEAVMRGANLIVTHHPVIFHPLRRVTADMLVYRLVQKGISVISAHTNLDIAPGGVNDILAGLLEFEGTETLEPGGLVRAGKLKRGMTPPEFAYYVKQKLELSAVRYCDGGRAIERAAVCGGSGGSELSQVVKAGCQAYVTADIKHDVMLEAARLGVTLLDAGHYATERHVLGYLCALCAQALGDTPACVAQSDTDISTTI